MVNFEWNQEQFEAAKYEEGREDGRLEGRSEGRADGAGFFQGTQSLLVGEEAWENVAAVDREGAQPAEVVASARTAPVRIASSRARRSSGRYPPR